MAPSPCPVLLYSSCPWVTKCVDSDSGIENNKNNNLYLTLSPPSEILRTAVD
jgi:hypothetical protein